MHCILFYELADDYLSQRAEFRTAHIEKAWKASERGELLLAGTLANPIDEAVLLFTADSSEVAEKFAKADPYVTNGLVKWWRVRERTTVAVESAVPRQTSFRRDNEKRKERRMPRLAYRRFERALRAGIAGA